MTAGLPGVGIGGLFYLASTILLPARSLWRRWRRRPDTVSPRQQVHSVLIALGIIGGLWAAGWALAFVVPHDMLPKNAFSATGAATASSVITVATFFFAIGTLVIVLMMVEVARFSQALSWAREDANTTERMS